jgi:hypothetical protein
MLMIYVIKVARYACGEDAHVLTNRFLMPCNHVLFYLFVSKHKEKKSSLRQGILEREK